MRTNDSGAWLGAGILVVIIVFLGLIALVVPGVIFATWYAYTTPAIMLEDKGATEGMSASKAFGRDKKLSTFMLFLAFIGVYIIVAIIGSVLSLGGGGRIIQTLLDIPLSAWTSVVIAYTYITCGPSSTPATETMQPNRQTPSPAVPSMQPMISQSQSSSTHSFVKEKEIHVLVKIPCRFCGTLNDQLAAKCQSCGAPIR